MATSEKMMCLGAKNDRIKEMMCRQSQKPADYQKEGATPEKGPNRERKNAGKNRLRVSLPHFSSVKGIEREQKKRRKQRKRRLFMIIKMYL